MVELGVGEDRNPAVELEQRAVGLVGLDHQPLPRPPAGVRARRAHLAADQVGRIRAAAAQGVDEHARGRRLAVGAGDGDRRPQPGQLGEQVGAVQLAASRPRARGSPGRSRSSRRPRRPSGTLAASWPTTGSIPASRSRAAYEEPPERSEPVTDRAELAAPRARARSCPRRRCPRSAGGGHPMADPWAGRLMPERYQRLPAESGVERQPPLPGLLQLRVTSPARAEHHREGAAAVGRA